LKEIRRLGKTRKIQSMRAVLISRRLPGERELTDWKENSSKTFQRHPRLTSVLPQMKNLGWARRADFGIRDTAKHHGDVSAAKAAINNQPTCRFYNRRKFAH